MNIEKLKLAEQKFYERYPDGFSGPEMVEIEKKHKPAKMNAMAQEFFAKERFGQPIELVHNMVKVVTSASMVSVFEKPKFRDYVKELDIEGMQKLSRGLEQFLHGDQETGFNLMVEVLQPGKLAKWTLLTICGAYYYPETEVFIKPTTVKGAIEMFELEGLKYTPKANYPFYVAYREAIMEMKKIVNVTQNNAAFGGFLMISME